MNYLLATVWIRSNESHQQLANRLSILLHITFQREDSRFDEVPAYVAEIKAGEFVLFGAPEGQTRKDEFVLSLNCATELDISNFMRSDQAGFNSRFVREKPLNDVGAVDYSEELGRMLREGGLDVFDQLLPVDV